jgi:hypothetical protein
VWWHMRMFSPSNFIWGKEYDSGVSQHYKWAEKHYCMG